MISATLDHLRRFLFSRDWTSKSGADFDRLVPPPSLGLPKDFYLVVPNSDTAPDLSQFMRRLAYTLSEIYALVPQQVEQVVMTADTVMSLSIKDEETTEGSISFGRFEGVMEKLKGILLHSAAFALSEDPIVDKIPPEADLYLAKCRFLQTAQGSFVTNVQMPTTLELRDRLLFEDDVPRGSSVTERVIEIINFSMGHLLSGRTDIYSDEFVTHHLDIININVLEDVRDLIQRVPGSQLIFSFLGIESTQSIQSGLLTSDRRQAFTDYVKFIRSRISENVLIDVTGQIVELRSRNPQSNRNYVLVQGQIEGQRAFLAVTLRNDLYAEAITAHRASRAVRVRGFARQMKTQYKIVDLDLFSALR